MKTVSTHYLPWFVLFLVSATCVKAQDKQEFTALLKKGKAEFKKKYKDQNYTKAVAYLYKAVQLQPSHVEARYFLGYAYDRFNSKSGETLINSLLHNTQKASQQFEQVIRLTKGRYQGEKVLQGPYAKITAIWGSLALAYQFQNKKDSVVWALQEGKRRGGFGPFILAYNKLSLANCHQKGVLLVSGDNILFPLMYLQKVENFRKDVTVLDAGLLASSWYAKMLQKQQTIDFGLSAKTLDTLDYCRWRDSTVTIGKLSWNLKPMYLNGYLLRNHRLMLAFLQKNNFAREVFLSYYVRQEDRLNLEDKLVDLGGLQKVDHQQQGVPPDKVLENTEEFLKLLPLMNPNNEDDQSFVTKIRLQVLLLCYHYVKTKDKKRAKQFIDLHEKYMPGSKYPFNVDTGKYFRFLKTKLQ